MILTAHSVKSSPSPDPEEAQAKDELVYRYLHTHTYLMAAIPACTSFYSWCTGRYMYK